MNDNDNPSYVLMHPDGRAEWGSDVRVAESQLGPYGVGRGPLTPTSRLRLAMSDVARIMTDVFELNPYARVVLAHVAGVPVEEAPEARGPIILFGHDVFNDWDSSRPMTDDEYASVTVALKRAECIVTHAK